MQGHLLVTAVVLGTSLPAAAQVLREARAAQGYYLSVGALGMANANRAQGEGWLPTWPGWGTSIRAGESLTDWLGIGLSIQYGQATGKKRQATLVGFGLELNVNPVSELVLRVAAGIGGNGISTRDPKLEDDVDGRFGESYTLGVSYAFFPFQKGGSGGLALSPLVQATLGPDADFTGLAVWAGMEVTWWLGLQDNRLDLSVDEAFRPRD